MSRKFESHITCLRGDSVKVEAVGSIMGWTFSAIDGDPVMGKQAYAYLTAYDTDGVVLHARMRGVSCRLEAAGCQVLREKVEEIVYDTKTGHDVLIRETHV